MNFRKTPMAVAALALCGAMPILAQAAPTVSWSQPLSGATLRGTVSGSACAVTTSSTATRVTFNANSWQINNDYSSPFNCEFDTTRLSDGSYTLRARAYDASGAYTDALIPVTINNNGTTTTPTNTAPTVSITSPTASQTVAGTINYAANATDNAGVARVSFFLDGSTTALVNDTSSPYGGSLNTTALANGAHTLRAIAYDAAGLSSSSQVSFNVQNTTSTSDTTAPAVSMTSPTASQTVSGTLNYAASATDNVGVARVAFYLDGSGTALLSDTSSPYGGSLNTATLPNGTHTLRAVAYDAAGLSTSSQVSFNVQNTTTSTGSTTSPTVAWMAPLSGATLRGRISGSQCAISAPTTIRRTSFYATGWQINNDYNAPFNCDFDTTRLKDGPYTLRARTYNTNGGWTDTSINVTIANNTAAPAPTPTEPTPTNTAPTVSITSPTASQTVAGTVSYAANATDDAGVARVAFYLDGSTTALLSDTASPYGGSLNTTTLPNGTHTLRAVAFDAAGLSTSTQVSFNVQNTTTSEPPTSSLPSTGVRVVPTFQSLGVYWASPGGSGGCKIQYRKAGESAFKQGLDLWYDSRNNECRGSLVQLQAGSDYEIQLGLVGQSFSRGIVTKTWSEQFPIAQTITVPAGTSSQPITITQGGTPSGYILYQAAPGGSTIDVQDAYQYNIRVAAPYVIIRGLTLRGARQDAIDLRPGAHDVVIENNDISGWGRYRTTIGGKGIGIDMDSGVRGYCANNMTMERFIIQRNRIHSPRYSANSWDSGHPAGPQGVTLSYCGGNHVIRHNEIAGSATNFFNDGIGGEDNFTASGAPKEDTDIYGNLIRNVHDDAIEAEGSNRNVRIWGNYIDQTAIGIASTVTHHGPLYVFRNVVNRQRFFYNVSLDSDDRNNLFKSGSDSTYGGGRRYVFHNTSLQAQASGATRGLGAGGGLAGNTNQPLTNTVSRNNIYHVWQDTARSVYQTDTGNNNDVDYDLYNGRIFAETGAEANGILGRPTYRSGHGWSSESGGLYQLEPGTAGHDRGIALPNFNDGFIGGAPDMGAAETGAAAMRFGPAAADSPL